MTAKEYFETKKRMTNNCLECFECYLNHRNNGHEVRCEAFEILNPDEAIAIVQKWGEEHPVKTLMDKFFEVFPNAKKMADGSPYGVCPYKLGLTDEYKCYGENCLECWSQPYIEPKGKMESE